MYFILILIGVVYLAVCLFLVLIILLQSGKGGGLSGMLGGSNPLTDTLGSSGAEKTLNKWTTVCAVGFFVMSLMLTLIGSRIMKPTRLSDQLKSSAAPATAPGVVTSPADSQSGVVTITSPETDQAEDASITQEEPVSESTAPAPSTESATDNP